MSFFGVTQELLDDLRRKAIKVKIVEDNRTSIIMEFSESEIDLILTFKPAMILAIVDRIEMLEAELADRPMVFAIQHIETKTLSDRGDSVDLYTSVAATENAIRSGFFKPSEHKAVIYTGRPI